MCDGYPELGLVELYYHDNVITRLDSNAIILWYRCCCPYFYGVGDLPCLFTHEITEQKEAKDHGQAFPAAILFSHQVAKMVIVMSSVII